MVFIAGAHPENTQRHEVLILISFPPYDATPRGQASPQKALSIHFISESLSATTCVTSHPHPFGPLRHSYALKRNVEPTTTTLYRWEKKPSLSRLSAQVDYELIIHPIAQRATTQSHPKIPTLAFFLNSSLGSRPNARQSVKLW